MARRGISRLSLKTFLSHTTEKTHRGTLFFRKISGMKKLHEMVYHNFVEIWFSHSTEKFRSGTLWFSEKFFYRKILWIGGGISRLSLENFLSHSTEKFLGGHFFSENFWIKKNTSDEILRFCRKMVFSQYRKVS